MSTKQERLVEEYVDRWYLSEEGDSESLKQSSKAEMRRQMKAIVDGEVTSVLENLEKQAKKHTRYHPLTGENSLVNIVPLEAIQTIKERYNA